MIKKFCFLFFWAVLPAIFYAQDGDKIIKIVNYANPIEYEIGGVTVSGVEFLDKQVLANMSGLKEGDMIDIPGEKITDVAKKFWAQGLFEDVKISITKIEGNKAYIDIYLKERPRLSKLIIKGLNKSETEDLEEKLDMRRGSQITETILNDATITIKNHFREKGFFNTEVNIIQEVDTNSYNKVFLTIDVDKNERVKIDEISISGNDAFSEKKIRRVMKNTKQRDWNIFKGSKYIEDDFDEDKATLTEFYNENGYRDFKILKDSISVLNDKRILLDLVIYEGKQYFFRDIKWVGNTKYSSEILNTVLGIEKGDIYDKTLLDKRLMIDEDAVTSLYMDDGYLFFSVDPVEAKVEGDSIDLEMQIYEGKQARINKVIIKGNTKTNEHVVRREIRTKPGELFSKSDIIRTVRELAALGHFNPETITPNPIPNQNDGTVDLEYQLEERANDQLEVSGGWGGYGGFVGTIGIRFSNFSARNLFDAKAWRPVPSGDGQTLSVRAQSNGRFYRGYNLTFIEPWLGGKKPNSFNISLFHSKYERFTVWYDKDSEVQGSQTVTGGSIGYGRRLSWPDDFFTLSHEVSYQRFNNDNYSSYYSSFLSNYNGVSNIISLKTLLARRSQDQMIFPRRGSSFSLTLEVTPPYSLLSSRDYASLSNETKFKFIEYHKWLFNADWYLTLVQNLVLSTSADFGILGYYNKDIGYSPYGGFQVGGDVIQNYIQYGIDIIPLRGYDNGSLTPKEPANLYDKFTIELRYPFSLNPSATIYGLVFLEGGNAWRDGKYFNPFDIKRSSGVGIRAFLPMFGMLGVDWGFGFDAPPGQSERHGGQFHFTIGQQF